MMRRPDAAVQPRRRLALGVERGFEVFERDRVVVRVAQIVFARPHHLHRLAVQLLGDERGFGGEVALALAAETAAEQRDVDGDVRGVQAEAFGDVVAHRLRALEAAPDLALAAGHTRRGRRRLHRGLRQVRDVVVGLHRLGGAAHRGIDIAAVANHLARLVARGLHRAAVGGGIVSRVRAAVPVELERFAALHRRPGVVGDHRHAGQRRKRHRQRRALDLDDLHHAGHLQRGGGVEALQRRAEDRRARDHGVEHVGQHDVLPIDRAAGGHRHAVDQLGLLLADVAKLRRRFQAQRVGLGHRQLGRVGGDLAEAELAPAGLVDQLVLHGRDFGRGHAPARGGRGFEHAARGGAAAAQRHEEVACRARAVGVLVAEARFVAGRLHDAHLAPNRLRVRRRRSAACRCARPGPSRRGGR